MQQPNSNGLGLSFTPIVILQINKTQDYSWGSNNRNCWVGRISNQELNRYAQYWMGTHPNGQSRISQQCSLRTYINKNNLKQVQILFKILSIEKCLSIQVHPNQSEAQQLHMQYPSVYTDDKDKPEMFLTISDKFQLFLGFIEETQLNQLLQIQPYKKLGENAHKLQYKQKILYLLEAIVQLEERAVQRNLNEMFVNLYRLNSNRRDILTRLYDEFKNDVGILVSNLLQYHLLEKGSCFGIEAGVPHAYIKGQCFQLMKSSDNVVRLGLTPKKKDIGNLIKIVRNNIHKSYTKINCIQSQHAKKYLWNSYQIIEIQLQENTSLPINIQSDSIGIVTQGLAQFSQAKSKFNLYLKEKTVFYILKAYYNLLGHGKIYIASKL